MYCPKCAAELLLQGGELTCPRGQMGLSKQVARVLTDRYGAHAPSPNRDVTAMARRGWYCPGCGVLLDGRMVCPECRQSLKDLEYSLVEFHPHQRPDRGWR
jgi:uncharacterized Zn finger protein (UPF0148 family)